MIKSFMIISKSGLPLYTRGMKKELEFDQTLVGGFLSAVQSFAESISKSCIDKLNFRENTFFYSTKDDIMSIVVADSACDEVENRIYHAIAERLGRIFIESYNQEILDNWNGNLEFFKSFDVHYESITSEIVDMLKTSHRDLISHCFCEAAKNDDIVGMIVFDLENDEIIASDIPTDFSEKDFESFSSMLFAFTNRLGKALNVGTINELLLRAKNFWIGGFRKGSLAVFMIFKQDYFGQILPEVFKTTIDNID